MTRYETYGKYYFEFYVEETGRILQYQCKECLQSHKTSIDEIHHAKGCSVVRHERAYRKKVNKINEIKTNALKKLTKQEIKVLGL